MNPNINIKPTVCILLSLSSYIMCILTWGSYMSIVCSFMGGVFLGITMKYKSRYAKLRSARGPLNGTKIVYQRSTEEDTNESIQK